MIFQTKDIQVLIRHASLNDIDDLYNIESVSFGNHHWSKQAFKNEISNNYAIYLVAELLPNPSKLVGYIGSWLIEDEGHITTLAISPNFRRKHIADILLYNLVSRCITNHIKWLTLEVRISNLPAINLYKKFGFNQLGIRKKYYQDNNEDGLIFWSENITSSQFQKSIQDIIFNSDIKKMGADKLQYITPL